MCLRHRFTALIPCLCLLLVSAAFGDTKKSIQAQYNRWSKAYMANDVDTLLDILSPDYKLVSVDKDEMTYAIYKAYLQLKKKAPKVTTKYSTRITKLTLHGPEAWVNATESMVDTNPNPRGGKTTSTHQHEYLDKWRLDGKTWHLFSTETLKESTTTSQR